MMQTSAQTVQNFYLSPPTNRAARETVKILDAKTKHRIYDRLLELLSNPQIKVKKTGFVLPSVLHPLTKQALVNEHGFTTADIAELEGQVTRDADENLNAFEILRDAPAALFHALEKNGDSETILDNRIVPLPDLLTNGLVCEAMQKEFPRRILLICDGFIEQYGADKSGVIHKAVRVDIGGWIIRRGFILPMYVNGLIVALQIFRHPQDQRPFRLKSRIQGESNGDQQ